MQLRSTLITLAKNIKGAKIATIKFKQPCLNREAIKTHGEIKSKLHYIFNASVICGVNNYKVNYLRQVDECKYTAKNNCKVLENHILYDPNPARVYELLAHNRWAVDSSCDENYPKHKQEIIRYITMICENMSKLNIDPVSANIEDNIMLIRGNNWNEFRLLTSTDSPVKTLAPFLKMVDQIHTNTQITAIDIYDNDKNELLRIDMDISKI